MPGIFGLTKREQRSVEAAISRPANETELRERPDRVGQYLKSYLDNFVFDQFSDKYIKRAGSNPKLGSIDYMKGIPIPLRKEDVAAFHSDEGLSVLVIAENMAWIIGADPKFKYTDEYIRYMIQNLSNKIDEYLCKEAKDAGEKEDFDNACIHFRAALCVKPYYLDAMYGYARSCRKMYENSNNETYIGNFKAEALDYLELVTEIHPKFVQSYYYLGYMYLNMGLYAKAKLAWEVFVSRTKISKDKKEIKMRLKQIQDPLKVEEGYNNVLAQRWDEGIILLEPYLETSYSEWWPLSYYLGVAYAETGRRDEAKERFGEVLKMNPSHMETMRELSDIYQSEGNKEKAKKYKDKAALIEKGGHKDTGNIDKNKRAKDAKGATESLIKDKKLPEPEKSSKPKKLKKEEKKEDE